MFVDLSEYVLEAVGKNEEFTLHRGRLREEPQAPSLLLLAPVSTRPAPQSLRKMEHEYSLRAALDPGWAVRPLALAQRSGQTILVLEDPGGAPLDQLIEGPMEIGQFLRLAAGLAAALSRLHKRDLIHKDVKPSNVLAKASTGEVWLMGFGIASRLPRERQFPEPPEFIAGTLPYMAPEQTGRMNRSIDSRSDLYALGVTLYEMLTGRLPFTASDPMEWVHCHIARQPLPPGEQLKHVPGSVSAILMKLLAKIAEERYQTAAGAERDLRRCLAELETQGCIVDFPVGEDDTPDRVLIPEKLYGRAGEIGTLVACFDRVVTSGRPELLLVSGYSGIGKSSVVNELHKVLVPPRGLFASGKFDQYKRDIPYATLAQAFQSLIRTLLTEGEVELRNWREALVEALGPNGRLIVDLVPELRLIIGEQSPVPDLPPPDAQRRFQLVFRRFIGVFARPEHPLALFLDDLQWLDAATLDFLEDLLRRLDVRHLMLIGAYRDNEVSFGHPLIRKLEAIRQAGTVVHDIVLAPLTCEDLGQLVAESIHCELERAAPLARLVQEKTSGNPFFAIQFISALAEERLIVFDHGDARWSWDLDRIHAKGYTDNVVDLIVRKLSRLPVETQRALQQLACLGNSAEFTLLAASYGDSKEEMHGDLREAVRAGIVLPSERAYMFLHNRFQEAAYSQIPENERGAAHLRIGRLLASLTAPADIDEKIFEIVNQLNRGAHLITAADERERVAQLNFIAGRRAKMSTAYASALAYLAAARALLAEESWDHDYEFIFDVELCVAECELLTANMAAAEDRLSMLARRAKTAHQIAAVARLRLALYTTLGRSNRGVDVCLEYLRLGGTHWSPHPTSDEARREYDRIWEQLGTRSIEELIDLPLMTDPDALAALDVLTEVVTPALFTDENLSSLVICRMVNLSLEHGNSARSCFGYVVFGFIAGPRFGNYEAGFRFGRLGCDLVEKPGLTRYQARTYMCFGNIVMPWTKHIRDGRELVRRAFDAANTAGDLTCAAYSCNMLITNLLAAGDPLAEVQREAEQGLDFAEKARLGLVINAITAQLALVRTLRGLTPTFGCFDDEQFNELQFERHLSGDSALTLGECWYLILKVQARFLAGDYAAAVDASLKAQRQVWTSPSLFETAEHHFYGALCHAASCDPAFPDRNRQNLDALAAHYKLLQIWAENCPEYFDNRAALVGAVMARIEHRELDAEHFYEQAIRSAHANGFVHNEALANELAARFYAARGFGKIAHAYLQEARYCYSRWGADGKVLQLDRLYPRLRDVEPVPGRATTIATPVENLDLATVIRVAQAVSGEIALPKLIQNLARIAIEHAGADRGLLILLRGNHPHIEAEATTGHGRAAVTVRGTAVTPFDLPQSALQYVIRTHERVLLDDASVGNLYSEDEYIRRKRPRSVLFVPIVKQTKLMGALYLENTLTPCVFTPDRVTVLELLALQASISLENASLYSDLQRSEAFLAEGQGISHTGSFGWKVANGEIHWSAETYNIFEEDRAVKPTVEMILRRTHPDDRDLVEQTLDRACEAKADFDVEHRLLMSDGSVKHLHVLARALTTSSENLEFVGAVTDTTATKQAEEALRASERSLRLIVDTIPGMTATMTAEGEIELLNQQILDYTGKTTEEMRHWPPLIHPDDRAVVKTQWSHSVQTGEPYDNQHRILRADGVYRWFQVRGQPLRNKEGRIVRWYMLMSDIEERKQAEEKLRRSEADLLEAQRLSHTGNWKHDIASGTFTVSPEVYRMFGASPDDDSSGLGFWVERVHPEDQKRTQTLFERSVIDKTDYLADYRIVLPDGTIRRQHAFGRPILNASGDLVEFVGTTMDVTEQWQARAALVEAFEEIKRLKDRLEEENVALREEIDKASMFEEIVGVSAPIQRVLSHISKVARTDSNVLVTGETGTGKELVARAIHRTSQRSSHPFVSVNCAAIPRDLIASELFGHERGAFTGATQRRLGRFEVADKGTIFLDEIGELPPETQIALLRVLQEHEFERVGGTESIRTDARIIAATNRDLEAAIAGGMFRSDLFYRLNVFPIEVPPLRKRREDIPMLVEYFIDRYARKAGKTFRSVNKRSLDLLQSYPWPGNIRELQNVIERSVIMCESETFSVDNGWLSRRGRESEQNSKLNPFRELASQEKVIIEAALRASRGRVYGPAGAAARLGMPRSTLESKIRSLKINKSRFKDTDPSNTA